jgi:molybdopterin synthase catalytic subunit
MQQAHGSITVLLTEERLSVDAAFNAVCRIDCGGTALFVGTTRSPSEGRDVAELSYEAYEELARSELARVAEAAVERHGLGAVYVAHRVGTVPLGEPSVVVAAAAAHRAEAFAGARELIDELKRRVPIWKRERWAGGGRWVGVPEEAAPAVPGAALTADRAAGMAAPELGGTRKEALDG